MRSTTTREKAKMIAGAATAGGMAAGVLAISMGFLVAL
jgi:hypothetical protein